MSWINEIIYSIISLYILYIYGGIYMRKAIDLTGQKFGKWTVIKRSNKQTSSCNAYWVCQCECGVIKDICGTDLRRGRTTQCLHCYRSTNSKTPEITKEEITTKKKEKIKKASVKKNEIGNVYGELTVIKESDKKGSATYWTCQCSCGNYIDVRIDNLTSGRTKSCGCIKSRGEQKIQQILEKNSIIFKKEYSFQDLRGINNGLLRFDFALFDKNYNLIKVIEYQGRQHYKDIPKAWTDIREHDNLKRVYCKQHNIKLLEIPYTDFDIIDINYLLYK